MKTIFWMTTLALFVACSGITVTDTEVKAVDKVLEFYGGMCGRQKGFNAGTGKNESYFELDISKSQLIEKYADVLEMVASNVAYIFYTNLDSEKSNFTNIKVKITLADNSAHEYNYPVSELSEAETFTPLVKEVADKLRSKDYSGLLSLFAKETGQDLTEGQLRAYCMQMDSAYGDVKEAQFQGYAFFTQNNREAVHVAFITARKNNNVPTSLFVDRNTKKILALRSRF